MILISLLESMGIFLLIPLIGITGILDVSTGDVAILRWVNELFQRLPEMISLLIILGIYVLLIVSQSIFGRRQKVIGSKIQQGFIRHLKDETYKSLLQANWGFYLRKRKSDIINMMTTEIFNVSSAIQLFLQMLSSLVFTFIQISIAFYLSAKLTGLVILFGIILIVLSRKFIKRSRTIGKETFQLNQTYIGGITDHFNGIKDIKSNSLEDSHLNWFLSLSKRMEKNRVALTMVNTKSQMIFKIISAFLIAIFVFISIQNFKSQSTQLILILAIFSRLWPRFSSLQSNLEQIGSIIPSLKALAKLQNESLEARELNNRVYNDWNPIEIVHGINCNKVYFKYNQDEGAYALKDINLHIPINCMTAIVGRSGAGKSTLIDILMGLNRPESGEVTIDGVPLTDENLLRLRRSISYIPQDPFLFNATIRENLMIIDPNANDNSIWEALDFAAAADFVRELPQGLDTLIGDRGIRLSGGERQRLVLARAILRKPTILVLDEATSALDTENEAKIQRAIERLKGSMTIIVIAHRLSTIRNSDQVLVLDQGQITQVGEYSQLAKEKRGVFSNLQDVQLGSQM